MTIDTDRFKQKLEAEKKTLEQELDTVGRKNPDNPGEWEAIPSEKDTSQADDNTVADGIEDYEENGAILKTLEARYHDVQAALKKIEEGTYGICEVSGEQIEADRLEANPAARTCKDHMN